MRFCFLVRVLAVLCLAGSIPLARPESKAVTVTGYVLDSACAFTKGLKKPISVECAQKCAKNGSPLVILADNGAIYWPTTDAMPADSQNGKLMPFAGQRVTASGKLFERGGSRALMIEKIDAAK
ncbi:MAG TPA: hypothetical protein VKR61_17670 [Bryobacteraceae bacterium]|nr:hypothetical protein [Bryobacteraceae bacterium]